MTEQKVINKNDQLFADSNDDQQGCQPIPQKITVSKLFDGEKLLINQTIQFSNQTITDINDAKPNETITEGLIIPGYIDIQVNGGAGYLFNDSPCVETIEKIGRAHQAFGTVGWLPTLITDSFEKMKLAADAVSQAIKDKVPGVLGIHFEGPFLSKEKKGVHSENFIREFSEKELELFTRKDLGKVLVTLAPEKTQQRDIVKLIEQGVIVSLGHSNATLEQTNQALAAGATGITHLFNAMSAFTSREPGMVGAALLAEQCFAGIILDGIHVHTDSAKLAYQMNKNLMLVTDAMPPVGSEDTSFKFFSDTIKREGLKLTDSNGRLAGSALDMHSAVKNAQQMLGINLIESVGLASKNPARFLGLEEHLGQLKIGNKASMLLLDNEQRIQSVWIDGQKIN